MDQIVMATNQYASQCKAVGATWETDAEEIWGILRVSGADGDQSAA